MIMIAAKRSLVVATIILWLSLGAELGLVVHALSSLSPSSLSYSATAAAASTSPLFRYCPPPQGPQDQQQIQQHRVLTQQPQSSLFSFSTKNSKVNIQALQALGYPQGLCRALLEAAQVYPKRYWIIDDSRSMSTKDGHFLLHTPQRSNGKQRQQQQQQQQDRIEQAPCTRWNELQETVLQHALLAHHLDIPTDFRLLNHATGHFRIPRTFGQRSSSSLADVQQAQKILSRTQPKGVTPLTARLKTVHKELEQSVLSKLSSGQKVAIVLATDGLPTNANDHGSSTQQAKEDFRQALQALPSQQVSVVIRLCTDDASVVSYYNQLKEALPHVQVLDDYWAEAAQVHAHNPWLNYGLALHRIREMGCCCCDRRQVPLLKVLAQRPLTLPEVATFLAFLLDWTDIPSFSSWQDLVEAVNEDLANHQHVWNPISGQLEPWVDLTKLHPSIIVGAPALHP